MIMKTRLFFITRKTKSRVENTLEENCHLMEEPGMKYDTDLLDV